MRVFKNGDGDTQQVSGPVSKFVTPGKFIINNFFLPALFISYPL